MNTPTDNHGEHKLVTTAPATVEQPKNETWHSHSAEEVLAQLGSAATGLSATEAAQRLAANGPNEMKEGKRISPLQIFLGQFKSLLIVAQNTALAERTLRVLGSANRDLDNARPTSLWTPWSTGSCSSV